MLELDNTCRKKVDEMSVSSNSTDASIAVKPIQPSPGSVSITVPKMISQVWSSLELSFYNFYLVLSHIPSLCTRAGTIKAFVVENHYPLKPSSTSTTKLPIICPDLLVVILSSLSWLDLFNFSFHGLFMLCALCCCLSYLSYVAFYFLCCAYFLPILILKLASLNFVIVMIRFYFIMPVIVLIWTHFQAFQLILCLML